MNKSDIIKAAEEAHGYLTGSASDCGFLIYKKFPEALIAAAELLKQADNKWLPASEAPKGVPLIVEGGIAMKKKGDDWFTGMHEPQYTRKIQWEVKWFQFFPQPPVIIENGGV